MPFKFETDKLKIKKCDDKRIKLTNAERHEIKQLYGKISQRKLAKLYNVSRRLIIFIGCPEKYEQNLKCREERGGSMQYYNKQKHTKIMKKHRTYKKELYDNDKLI